MTKFALFALAVVALSALWLRAAEPRLIYYPLRAIELTPDRVGLSYQDISLTAADGVRLNGWFLPADGGLTVLFLHGNAGNISHRLEKLAILHELGAAVFILDYRGYGRSEGRPSEQGLYLDAQAAYRHLVRDGALDPCRVVVYGESLGAAVAVDLASRVAVGGVILEAAFTSTPDVGRKLFPFLPLHWLVRERYDALARIGQVNAPLLIFHSRDDEFLDMRHARRLLDAAAGPKELVELRGGHNDAFLVSAERYRDSLRRFLGGLEQSSCQGAEGEG